MRKIVLLILVFTACGIADAQSYNSTSSAPKGAINGLFSVSENVRVFFSQGNLQYIGSAVAPYWKFADNQWDCFGVTTGQNLDSQNVDIDLFGWDQADWGRHLISNGGNRNNIWRTLSNEEWSYVFDKRNTSSGIRYAKAQVNGVNGVILLPDNWKASYGRLKEVNQPKASYSSNVINVSKWKAFEQQGAVFLPAAGHRHKKNVINVGSNGDYWSVSPYNDKEAWYVYFLDDRLHTDGRMKQAIGHSVRLVHGEHGVPFAVNTTSNPPEAGTINGSGTYDEGTRCSLTATSNPGWVFFNWTENEVVVSDKALYTFVVNKDRNLVANFINSEVSIVDGALSGVFSVGEGKQVHFSQGNLMYIGSSTHPYWKFAEHQWDYLGNKDQGSDLQSTNRDLFGWGTSGYHGFDDSFNTNYRPWSTTIPTIIDNYNYYGYGPSLNNASPDLTGASKNYDWGVNNPIVNGGNKAGLWRTLTREEWSYVLNSRETPSGIRYAKAIVNNVNGMILLPDNWNASNFLLYNTNQSGASFVENTIALSQWLILEQYGAVFLPAAGDRYDTSILDVGCYGNYWSASSIDGGQAWFVVFFDRNLSIEASDRYFGQSVRLVQEIISEQ